MIYLFRYAYYRLLRIAQRRATPSAPKLRRSVAWPAYLIALLVGLVLAATTFPAWLLFPQDAQATVQISDPAQHIVGQRYFIADSWRWPLLTVPALGWPDGTNIAFTDSIPALALLAKLARSILPPGFHTIHLWLALAYMLQPISAVYALRGAGERRLLPVMAIAVIAASMPALFWRMSHAALSGHFLILLALGLYFRICEGQLRATWLGPVALLLFSLLVHPYLMIMAATVLAAAPMSLLLRRERGWRQAACGVAAGLVATSLAWIQLGYGDALAPPGSGFSLASMNLLSPIYPGDSALLPMFGDPPDATGVQYEGYNYLGLGVLLLGCLAAGTLFRGGSARRLATAHAGLILACLALSLLSFSNHWYVGRYQIVNLGRVPDWLQQLRSCGRFFWPVAYSIVIASVAAVARIGRPFVSAVLLLTAASLQFADTSLLRAAVRSRMHTRDSWQIDVARLRPLLAAHQSLTIEPRFDCGLDNSDPSFLQLLLLASERVMPVNTMYVARFLAPDQTGPVSCGDEAASRLRDQELRVFLPEMRAVAVGVPESTRFCRGLGGLVVCTVNERLLAGLPPLAHRVPMIPRDTRIPTTAGAPSDAPLLGWSRAEKDGTWTDGRNATLVGRLGGRMSAPAELTVWGHSIAAVPHGTQSISVLADGRPIASWSAPEYKNMELHAALPPDLDLASPIEIRFVIDSPVRPIDRNGGLDFRHLGFFMTAFRIASLP